MERALAMRRKPAWLLLLGITGVLLAVASVSAFLRWRHRPRPVPSPAPLAERETWEVYRIRGARIGYGRTVIRHDDEDGRRVVKVTGLLRLGLARFDQPARMEINFTDTETPAGALLARECEFRQGPMTMRTLARVRGSRLEMDMTTRGERHTESRSWPADGGGAMGTEESLLRRPMKPGEHRVVHLLGPENLIETVDLSARQEEEDVALLDGTYRLLRIDMRIRWQTGPEPDEQSAAGQETNEIKGAVWCDASGEMLKSWLEPMEREAFRVPKEVAMTNTPLAKFDLGLDTLVRLDRPLPHGLDTRRARYRVTLDAGSPATVFVSGPAQQVRWVDGHTAEITVYAIRPGRQDSNRDAPSDPPTEADKEPNNFIQSADAKVVADARKVAPDETDPWRVALALEQFVHDTITHKDLAQFFVTAADVAATRQGDCKAHALYLAALARARGIPARVAVGLVYRPGDHAFAYHMWTEVFIQERWMPIDGTLAKGGVGAGHLQLGHSNMTGVSAYASFLPAMQVIGQLHLELLDAE
jgi:hypothetical protein